MLRDLKNYGAASIVEVIITSVIFVVAAAGILSTVSMFRPQGADASKKIEAAYIGKGFIDQLRQQVNAENWGKAGDPLAPNGPQQFTVGIYTVDYEITEPSPGAEYRYLTMNITFPDS